VRNGLAVERGGIGHGMRAARSTVLRHILGWDGRQVKGDGVSLSGCIAQICRARTCLLIATQIIKSTRIKPTQAQPLNPALLQLLPGQTGYLQASHRGAGWSRLEYDKQYCYAAMALGRRSRLVNIFGASFAQYLHNGMHYRCYMTQCYYSIP
jgi:hypothetical protein